MSGRFVAGCRVPRKLMADVIAEDERGSFKTFTRDELIELIAMPV